MSEGGAHRTVTRWRAGEVETGPDELAEESPLEIQVRGRSISVTMRTPGADPAEDEELAAGFLFTEGVISSGSDIVRIAHCPRNGDGNVLKVMLAGHVVVDLDALTRHVFAASSCGVCGKACIASVMKRSEPLPADPAAVAFDPRVICTLPDTMRRAQETFDRTGGLHAAGLFAPGGELLVLREDVGRHNAVDKVIGHVLLGGDASLDRLALLVSGRVSFEIVQKALVARIPLVAAVSAPSALAVQCAEEAGQTLIGFLRGERMNVYTSPGRLGLGAATAPDPVHAPG